MIRESLAMYCTVDFSGAVRGKGAPAARAVAGLGWTPTNLMFTPLGTVAPSPWGPHGDLLLRPDPSARVEVEFGDGSPAERFTLCDLVETDGAPWACCPRTLLREATAALHRGHGLTVRAAFEHEFVLDGVGGRPGDMYALDAVRRHGGFGETLVAALRAAGVAAESYLAEFGAGQFEVTVPPADALAAADRAVILRELVRATAWRLGHGVTFSPKPAADGIGSGVHIHLSLWDATGPASHDPAEPHGVSAAMGSFLAGVVRHMPALCAFTAPSPVSYLRLVPHAWTGVWSNIGARDREAGLRLCPTFGPPADAARQFNAEYRAADATANPYLALAAVVVAGTLGLAEGLAMPEPTVGVDPEALTETERAARSIVRLPRTLGEALDALEADAVLRATLPPTLVAAYLANKRHELELTAGWDAATLCRRYAEAY